MLGKVEDIDWFYFRPLISKTRNGQLPVVKNFLIPDKVT